MLATCCGVAGALLVTQSSGVKAASQDKEQPQASLTQSKKQAAEPSTHLLFRNVTIYDGSGQPSVVGSVYIRGGRIIAIGKEIVPEKGATEIEGRGLCICPGFIDLHTHCDYGLTTSQGRANKNYVMQGCTTVVTGNCGSGPTDLAKYFQTLEEGGIGTNVIHLAPHNSIRAAVMGNANRPPSANELQRMEQLVDEAMRQGAWGLSTGLIYNPGIYAQTEEIIALARVAGRHGGLYVSHIRNEGTGLLDALEEAFRIGRESGCRVHISHLKASGKAAWGLSAQAIRLIEAQRRNGLIVTADQYPYTASSTSLRATLVPARYREGTAKEFLARLDDPRIGPQLRADIARELGGWEGARRLQIAHYAARPQWNGQTIAAIAEAEKKEPIEIVLEIERNGGAQIVNFGMNEEDVRLYMRQSWVATASDGGVQIPGSGVPHPRSYGTFPRKIGYYALQEKLLPVEQAIRSATGLPADILQLSERGYLKPGFWADVVVFDPQTFRDTATFDRPHQYPTGVRWVLVNGWITVREGVYQEDVRGGRVLRWRKPS
ncbi:MAG: amidohydrolase family protein [Gemmataceae bacterium]|nr:amidohydrolase family protein [Gemmataceae bacterium]